MQIIPVVNKTIELRSVLGKHKAHFSLEQVRKLLKSGEQKENCGTGNIKNKILILRQGNIGIFHRFHASGKATLFSRLPHFYEPDKGTKTSSCAHLALFFPSFHKSTLILKLHHQID